jgi:hypothetical protein
LKIAIHSHYAGQQVAETEFSKRICLAARNIGWEAFEVATSTEINQCEPDFVIALAFRTPKLTRFPTYGSMVTPPVFFGHDAQFIKNIVSYDAYLCSSEHIKRWLKDILYLTPKEHFIAPWFTSTHHVPYRSPQLTSPRLLYTGTNWDGPRYGTLFERLDSEPYLDVYGPQAVWSYLKHSYRGSLPFDGVSILNALNNAGVGLCLHRTEHSDAATPSSRIFEIAASGAIAICQEHPFVRDVFQDAVLYLESTDDVPRLASQISEYMRWIAESPDDALTLSRRAYEIFSKSYTLEKLLSELIPRHQELVAAKQSLPSSPRSSRKALGQKSVQYIVRVGERGADYVQRALDSIASQSYGPAGAVIVQYKEVPHLSQILDKYHRHLPVQLVQSPYTGSRSTQLWDGLRAISSEYFGILDDDDVVYPNHTHLLVNLLERFNDCGVAYSGAIRVWEPDLAVSGSTELPAEPAELTYFEPFDRGRLVALDNFITSNAFVARSSLLKDLWDDPHLPLLEDLFLLLFLCRKTNFVFSYEASSEFRWRGHKKNNATWIDRQDWAAANERIKNLLWKQNFGAFQHTGSSSLTQVESKLGTVSAQLESRMLAAENLLAETRAKLDMSTTRLDRYLNLPFFDAIRRLRRKLLRLPPPPDI